MIAELRGTLLRRSPAGVVVDVGGVGFSMLVPLSTFRELADEGSEVHLFTYLHVREDALDLFAFATEAERSIFRELISVSGIGPKLGLAVLSGLSPEVFHQAVIEEERFRDRAKDGSEDDRRAQGEALRSRRLVDRRRGKREGGHG